MNRKPLDTADDRIANQQALSDALFFIFENAPSRDDWHAQRETVGRLLYLLGNEIAAINAPIDTLYEQHFAANENRRAH